MPVSFDKARAGGSATEPPQDAPASEVTPSGSGSAPITPVVEPADAQAAAAAAAMPAAGLPLAGMPLDPPAPAPAVGPVAVPPAADPDADAAADAAATDGSDAAAAGSDGTAETGTGSRIGRIPAAALAALALLAVLGTGYLAWQLWQESRTETARTEALETARDAGRLLFSYDHTQLEADFQAGLDLTTGDFREEYERTTREVVTPVATEYDAVVEAEVVEAAVVSADPEEVTALVYVNQTTTSTRVEGPKIDQSRVRMVLRKSGDEWLVSRVDAL